MLHQGAECAFTTEATHFVVKGLARAYPSIGPTARSEVHWFPMFLLLTVSILTCKMKEENIFEFWDFPPFFRLLKIVDVGINVLGRCYSDCDLHSV